MKKILVASALAVALATPAFAQKRRPARGAAPAGGTAPAGESAPAGEAGVPSAAPATSGYRPAYGMAGCGLGSMIIKSPSKGPQIGAWFINAIAGFQISGITSGTSNCKSKGGSAFLGEQETFVAANLDRLAREAAQGDGEHLASFAEVLGCEGDEAGALARLSQERHAFIFEAGDARGVVDRTHAVIRENALACTRV